MQSGPELSPRQRLLTYTDVDWELFIEEWASSLTPRFVQVKRLGGSGDRGADVAGFHSEDGFGGDWECFQGKFYGRALSQSDAWPEILKLFVAQSDGHYLFPRRYYFLAPKGMNTRLNYLLSSPQNLKAQFIEQLGKNKSKPFTALNASTSAAVTALAEETDFSCFRSVEVRDLIDQHRGTPYFAARFGGGLPARPSPEPTPATIAPGEATYVQRLIEAYAEAYGDDAGTVEGAAAHSKTSAHLQRQREAFFRAESLRNFARDSVPPQTFDALQNEIYDAVVETAEAEHATGLDRLRSTLDQATSVQITANALISVTETNDRKGICHQLANDERLRWIREG